jgi:hypothetical protein
MELRDQLQKELLEEQKQEILNRAREKRRQETEDMKVQFRSSGGQPVDY